MSHLVYEFGPVPAEQVFKGSGFDAHYSEGNDVELLGGSVKLDAVGGNALLSVLPKLMILSASGETAPTISWLLHQLDLEWRSAKPGSQTACNDLLRLMFIHILRSHLMSPSNNSVNWLRGLADSRIGGVLRAIHSDPAHNWTLPELAKLAGSSKSGFAAYFKEKVGVPPIDYIQRWRMRLAASRLRCTSESISSIAASLGYLSDSAFSIAFRRILGTSPTRYRSKSKEDV